MYVDWRVDGRVFNETPPSTVRWQVCVCVFFCFFLFWSLHGPKAGPVPVAWLSDGPITRHYKSRTPSSDASVSLSSLSLTVAIFFLLLLLHYPSYDGFSFCWMHFVCPTSDTFSDLASQSLFRVYDPCPAASGSVGRKRKIPTVRFYGSTVRDPRRLRLRPRLAVHQRQRLQERRRVFLHQQLVHVQILPQGSDHFRRPGLLSTARTEMAIEIDPGRSRGAQSQARLHAESCQVHQRRSYHDRRQQSSGNRDSSKLLR